MHNMKSYRWLIFGLLSTSYILVYFHRICTSVLAVDLMKDLNAGPSLIGLLGSAYFYPYALMQLPAGLLSDSWGARKTITLFFIVAFLGSVILGLAPTVTWAIIGRTMVGIGVSMLFVPTLKILSEWFAPKEYAHMTGLLLGMGGVGSLIAATPLVWFSNLVGWRNSFLSVGLITLLLSILIWLIVRNRPEDKGWVLQIGELKQKTSDITFSSLILAVRQVIGSLYFWPLAVWFFFDFAIAFSFGGLWGGPYLMHVYGMSRVEAGHILSMMACGLVVGAPFLTWLSDSIFGQRKPVLIITSAGMVFITALLTFSDSIPVWGLYILYFMITVCGNAVGAIVFAMNKELFPIAISGTATGLVNLFPFIGGALFQPFLGYMLERHEKVNDVFSISAYQSAFLPLFVCALIALGAALCSRETMEKPAAKVPIYTGSLNQYPGVVLKKEGSIGQ
ncbi:MAG: MFS transporter [Desulfamplus sp.]|nr:MFS transporter [Desulfamplus sp.]